MPKVPIVFSGLIGESAQIKQVHDTLLKVAPYDASVLIEGESGTGKELVARAIHFNSPRKNGEFIVVNCSAFSDNLLESELFGHMRGSFTGAIAEKKGLFELADKGTFFLDEVGDMSPALQVKLLRVLQEGVFFKVGGTAHTQVDVRMIAATNQNLKEAVANGKFREDLYYRLNVVHLTLPSLRSRNEDIPLLVEYISEKIAKKNAQPRKKVSAVAMKFLKTYRWPGNVRELENELEKAYILSDDNLIDVRHLSIHITSENTPQSSKKKSLKQQKKEFVGELEKEMIQEALSRSSGNQTRAARDLGISRQDLIRKIKTYKLS